MAGNDGDGGCCGPGRSGRGGPLEGGDDGGGGGTSGVGVVGAALLELALGALDREAPSQ